MYNINKIFELLKEKKLEQKDLAKGISVSTGNVTDWKKGRAKPSDKVMQKVADFFKLPLSDFYVYDESRQTEKDPPIDIEESEKYVQATKLIRQLTSENLDVLTAVADGLIAKQQK